MIRRHFFLVAAAAFLLLLFVVGGIKLATAGGKKPGAAGGGAGGRAAVVSVVVATPRPFADRIEVLGVAKGRQSVTITSDQTELVTAVHFRDGQAVRAGQILVDLKATEQDAGVAQAAALEAQAQRDYDRWKTLADRGVAPRASAEQYLAALQSAKAATAAARSRKLDRVIRAPFAGVVGLSDISPGSLVNPGSAIVSLDDLAVIRVDFDVPDRYLPVLNVGSAITASPDSLPGQRFAGRIAQIDTRVNTQTRAIKARAEFPNPSGAIRPGMLVKVAIDHGARQAVSIPESAIAYEGDAAYVFLLVTQGGKTKAQRRTVTIGASQGGYVEIQQGLSPGDKVVGDGLNRVQDGQAVKPAGGKPVGAAPSRAAKRGA
ncbi:membrane fusion protein (multidrug efflux system) [Caulobacter ginsengisoli]|uniref:Membrane fusion protein (Multidrug efflux system) n=1 Tax=Caulobacter ginsengisoli TaxID=400775 RepID=A0ABU0IL22_9CAUL|nr:efflux RND transporter periplasmic adaptor subunit [Caulobacter ginsengisoli]MDQ0462715.1 membrane fusion protein (multidrug efflux system) [Caulobacter ginsengisoli]